MAVRTLADLAAELQGEVIGEGSIEIRGVAGIKEAGPGDITFLANSRYDAYLDVPKGQDFDLYVWAPGTLDVWEVLVAGCGNRCPLVASGAKGKGKDEYVVFQAKTSGIFYFLVTDFAGHGKYELFVGAP